MLPPVSTASRAYTNPATRSRIVILMVVLSALSYFDRTILSIAGPTIMKELSISEIHMGWVYSSFLVTYAILMSPGGALADRFGPRWVLTLGGIGNTLLTGITGLCSRLGEFLSIRLIMGAASAPLYPSCACMTRNWFPPTGVARVMGLVTGASALGSAVSPMVFTALMASFGWRISFWIAALATGVLYLLWHAYASDYPAAAGEPPRAAAERSPSGWGTLLRNRNMVLLLLSYFCLNYFEYIFYYWIYYYFGQIVHLGQNESAAAVTVLMVTMMVMTPLGGWISDRLVARHGIKLGRRIVPLIGMTLSAGLLYAGASGLGVAATVALLSLAFGSAGSAEGPFWATAADIGGRQAGAACGLMNTGGNIGGILAPTITPLIASHFGWSGGLNFASLVVMTGVTAWFFIDASAHAK